MAFSLLVELPSQSTDWRSLNRKLLEYSGWGIEFFPISASTVFDRDYLGVSLINGEMTESRLIALKGVLIYLLECELEVFELYSGSQVMLDNIELLVKKFFTN